VNRLLLNIGVVLLFIGLGGTSYADSFDAMQYCTRKGGEVVKRVPYYNTNATLPNGGTGQFGVAGDNNGGGWINQEMIDVVLQACIFPDTSSVDSWG